MKFRAVLPSVVLGCALIGCARQSTVTTTSPEALKYYSTAVVQYEKFYYREALTLLDRALALDSAFCLAWGRRGLIFFREGDEVNARKNFARADANARKATLREQLLVTAWERWSHADFAGAAAAADSLINLYPKEKEAYLIRGFMYEAVRDYKSAIAFHQRAISIDTSYAMAVMSLGYAYSSVGDQEKAMEYMRRYIRLDTASADPRASYADLFYWAGRYEEALEQYEKSLHFKPDYSYSFGRIGEIYLLQGKLRAGGEKLLTAAKLSADSLRYRMGALAIAGRLAVQRGKYEEAVMKLREASGLDTALSSSQLALAYPYAKLKKFEEAQEILSRFLSFIEDRNLQTTATMGDYYFMKGRLLLEQGLSQDALEDAVKSLDYVPARYRGSIYNLIAESHLQLREYEAALDACEEGLTAAPNYPFLLLTLMKIYDAKRDERMTAEIGNRLLDFWKDADPDFRGLKEVHELLRHRRPA
jgi:tetratricopeptide (TPR) repeat protein